MRAGRRTLQSRLVRTTTIASALAMTVMVGAVVLILQVLTTNAVDQRLGDRAAAVSQAVVADRDGNIRAPDAADAGIDDAAWIYDSDGILVEGPRAGHEVRRVADSLSTATSRTRVVDDERVFLATPVLRDGTRVAVVVVQASLEPYEATRDAIVLGLIVLGVVATAGSAVVAAWTVRRTLAPVESMAVRAEEWSAHDLESRFEAAGTDDELARLGRTLNVLLDRVAGALRGEQQLTAELAHELRTPLTAIRGEVELARMEDPAPAVDARLGRVVELVDRLSATIAALLAVARGEHRTEAATTTADLLRAAVGPVPVRPGVAVVLPPEPEGQVGAPLELAVRALAPVVENAVRHAGTTVEIGVHRTDRVVEVSVSDDGAGIAVADPESLFAAGARGAGSPGAGLGLALARRVARTLGGDVTVTSLASPTTFTLTLPAP